MKYICIIFLFALNSCNNAKKQNAFKYSTKICDGIFVETYTEFGSGALGSDLVSDYLTDSINFKVRVGTFDNATESYVYKCKNNIITATKISGEKNNQKVIKKRTFHIDKLKEEKSKEK